MINIESIADLELLRESVDLECKLATGRDGQGALPEDFWPTYSAFANTQGGVVILGAREKQQQFLLEGIANPPEVFGAGSEQYDGRSAHSGCSSAHMWEPSQLNRAVDIVRPKLMAMNGRTMGWGAEVLSVSAGALQKTKGPSNRRSPMSTENPQSLREILQRCSPNLVQIYIFGLDFHLDANRRKAL